MTAIDPRLSPAQSPARIPNELLESSTFLLKRLGFGAKERAMAAYEATGLAPYHHAVLAVLDEGSPETQGSIADLLGYDRGQLVGFLDELEERQLIERRRDPNDRRRHLVQLTPEGKRTLTELRALSRRLENEFLEPLDESERATLHALLARLAELHEPRCAPIAPAKGR
jgi:DNA-binding MarR family transcriptional regulator